MYNDYNMIENPANRKHGEMIIFQQKPDRDGISTMTNHSLKDRRHLIKTGI